MNWRRRLALGLIVGLVIVVVWRFSAVMLRRAATSALEESGWTIVYEQSPPNSSAVLDRIAAQLGRAGTLLAGMLGREPEIVEIRIADMDTPGYREVDLSLLKKLPNLQRLFVQREALSASDIESIGAVGSLTELTIASDALHDESLSALAGLSDLRRLTIVSQHVSDDGLQHLHRISTLQFLDLQSTRAGGSGVEVFAGLEFLALGPYADNDDLQSVGRLPRLRELVLTDSRISDEGFRRLRTLEDLRVLHLSGPHTVTDDGLAVLRELQQLEDLTIVGQHFTFTGLAPLAESTTLEQLELSGRGLDDAGLDAFVPPPSLQVLRLFYTSVSDQAIDQFAARCPEIELWR